MHDDSQLPGKRPWRAPEMIDVGGAVDLTHGMDANVVEGSNPATWHATAIRDNDDKVALEDS